MAEKINNLLIYSSNASKKGSQKASVTVRDLSGDVLARVYSERSQPLRWLRKWPHCVERADLSSQLKRAGVSQNDIDAIVAMKEK
jgi:hypothetical protein